MKKLICRAIHPKTEIDLVRVFRLDGKYRVEFPHETKGCDPKCQSIEYSCLEPAMNNVIHNVAEPIPVPESPEAVEWLKEHDPRLKVPPKDIRKECLGEGVCNCGGTYKIEQDPCHCGVSRPPCSACENSRLVCDTCGLDPDEWTVEREKERQTLSRRTLQPGDRVAVYADILNGSRNRFLGVYTLSHRQDQYPCAGCELWAMEEGPAFFIHPDDKLTTKRGVGPLREGGDKPSDWRTREDCPKRWNVEKWMAKYGRHISLWEVYFDQKGNMVGGVWRVEG